MDTTATILAVSSPPGWSGRGIVRCSGPSAFQLLQARLELEHEMTRGIAPARFRLEAGMLPVQVLVAPGPASVTGEDVLELQMPGHPVLLERIIDELLATGHSMGLDVRRAGPGEFTARAFFNGRCSLTAAEGVAATISARSDAELRAATMLRTGRLGHVATALSEQVASALALVEAGIDFSDEEDVVAIDPASLLERLEAVRHELGDQLDRAVGMEVLQAIPRVVLRGRPNSGKSTLFNSLLGRHRAVTSDRAGTTRDVLVEPLQLEQGGGEDSEVLLVDLAGLDASDSSRLNRKMQDAARAEIDQADLLLSCIAPGDSVDVPDDVRLVMVHTKSDLGGDAPSSEGLAVSAKTGEGLDALRGLIQERLARRAVRLSADALALQPRHEADLQAAFVSIEEAIELVRPHAGQRHLASPELAASCLRRSLDALSSLAGDITPDDILGQVFAGFCIGK